MARSTLIHGASVVLYVNKVKYAKVIDFHFTVSTPRNKLYGIDAVQPFELALAATDISGSVTIYRQSQDGGAEGAGMATPMPELSREKYFSLMLIEEHSNTILFQASRCSLESQAWGVAAKQYVFGNLNFSAIDWSNEIRPGAVAR